MTVGDFEKAKTLFDRIKECDTIIRRLEYNNCYLLLPISVIDSSLKETTKEEKFAIESKELRDLIEQFYKKLRDQCVTELDKI